MKCGECDNMICREYYLFKDRWEGICRFSGCKVCDNDVCTIKRQVTINIDD